MNKRKILAACIAASLLSHILSLVFLQKHSFWAQPHALNVATPCLISMDKTESNKILRESFQETFIHIGEKALLQQQPRPEGSPVSPSPLVIQPIGSPPPLSVASSGSTIAFKHEFAHSNQKPSFALPQVDPLNLFEHLPKNLDLPALSTAGASMAFDLSPAPIAYSTSLLFPSLDESATHQERSLTNAILCKLPEAGSIAKRSASLPVEESPSLMEKILQSSVIHQMLHPKALGSLPDFPTLEELATSSYSDFFDTEIQFFPLENEEGYIFALTLVPQPGLTLPKIRQHYSFLIDRSNSIQKERLTAVKSAVLKALEELDLEDSFNIIAFDSKIEKLSSAPLPATSASLQAARNFLDQVHLGSFFSTANLYKPLLLTIPTASQDDDLHTAILFSDGETLSQKTVQRELALEWTRYNMGRVSLFAIGVGGDPHLATLDAVSAFNRGKILYPPTKKGIKRKLLKLIKTIGHPVGKNMSATAITRSSQTKISLYPKSEQLPSLYLNEPYVILGTIDKLDNFVLFIQGKLKNQWLNIRKNISFVNAKKGDAPLQAEWALEQAYSLYEKYLYDLDPSHLAEAKDLLEPHDLQVAFQ